MEFISAEEFLKQPEEIQKVFIDWWKCDNGDLYVNNYELKTEGNYCNVRCCNIDLESNLEGEWEWFKGESTPLLTECMLRKFIEDKGYFITLNATSNTYDLFSLKTGRHCKAFEYREKTILETYWKVALEIAKECIKNE
jgi:hypothetical protein